MTRRWAAWIGLWGVGASALLWGTGAFEAAEILQERRPVEVDEVAASDLATQLALPLGIVLTLAFAAALLAWSRAPAVRRGSLLVGGLALLVSGWAWTGVPDAGPLWPAIAVLAGALALLGATSTPTGTVAEKAEEGRPAGAGHRIFDTRWTWAGAVVACGAVALVALVPATFWLLDLGQLQRHEESESGWEAALPVVVGVGFLVAALAAGHRLRAALGPGTTLVVSDR